MMQVVGAYAIPVSYTIIVGNFGKVFDMTIWELAENRQIFKNTQYGNIECIY